MLTYALRGFYDLTMIKARIMRRLLLFLLAVSITNVGPVYAQGMRGGAVSGGFTGGSQALSSGGGLSQRPAMLQHRSTTAVRANPHRAWTRGHRPSHVSRFRHRDFSPHGPMHLSRFPHRGFPRAHRPGVVVKPRAFAVTPRVLVKPPLRPRFVHPSFRHHVFPRHRGLVIIGVPGFMGTEVIPYTPWPYFADTLPEVHPGRLPEQLAPFDPTPQEVVERMLALAGVKEGDVVYDLGAGDGRIAIAVAKKYGVRAVGFEIEPGLVKLARERVRDEGLEDLVEIRQQDFRTADLSQATVVTLYLSQDGNLAVRPLLMDQLKPGSRVVSYTFDMGDWPPKIVETYRDKHGDTHVLYLWQISDSAAYSEDTSSSDDQELSGELSMIIDQERIAER